jgi:DNA-binding transcriptional MerR regulator
MAYTVNQLAKASGVSIRTLRFYDQIGLLKPAYHGDNGYRYYEEEQLLMLQQILFFRELGFELKKIQENLGRSDFDKISALQSHKKFLKKEAERMCSLIETIEKTIKHLKGEKSMKEQDMYFGFSKEKQAEYEKEIIERFGEQGKLHVEESRQNVKNWKKSNWDASKNAFVSICNELTAMLENHYSEDSKEVQEIIHRHYECLKQFWTPDR